jgi:hypothetical protein
MITAVRLANESGKNGKPSVVVLHKQKTRSKELDLRGEPLSHVGFARPFTGPVSSARPHELRR